MIEVNMNMVKRWSLASLVSVPEAWSAILIVVFLMTEGARAAGDDGKGQPNLATYKPTIKERHSTVEDRLMKLKKQSLFVPTFSYSNPSPNQSDAKERELKAQKLCKEWLANARKKFSTQIDILSECTKSVEDCNEGSCSGQWELELVLFPGLTILEVDRSFSKASYEQAFRACSEWLVERRIESGSDSFWGECRFEDYTDQLALVNGSFLSQVNRNSKSLDRIFKHFFEQVQSERVNVSLARSESVTRHFSDEAPTSPLKKDLRDRSHSLRECEKWKAEIRPKVSVNDGRVGDCKPFHAIGVNLPMSRQTSYSYSSVMIDLRWKKPMKIYVIERVFPSSNDLAIGTSACKSWVNRESKSTFFELIDSNCDGVSQRSQANSWEYEVTGSLQLIDLPDHG